MPFIPRPQAQGLQDSVNTENEYLTLARQNAVAMQAQAESISQQRTAAPGLPADAYQSFATAGVDPTGTQFQTVASNYVPRVDTPSVQGSFFDRLGSLLDQLSTLHTDADGQKITSTWNSIGAAQQAQIQQRLAAAFAGDHTTDHHGDGWSWNPWHDLTHAASDIADGASNVWDFGKTEILRPTVRWGNAALSYPWEVLQNLAPNGEASAALSPAERLGDAFGAGTTLGQDIAHGSGTGWLSTTPDNQRRLNAIQEALRGVNAVGGPNSIGTTGPALVNLAARSVLHHDLIAPGSVAYGIVSGLTDLAAARAVDPAALGFQGWKAATALHDTFDLEAEQRAGSPLVNAIRQAVNPVRFDQWITKGNVQRAIAQVADTTNTGEIMRRLNFKAPVVLADRLARADNPDEVTSILRDAVGTELKYVPSVSHFGGFGGTAYGLRQMLGDPRWLAQMPDYGLYLSNPDQGARNIYLLGKEARLPESVIDARVTEFARVAADPASAALGPGAYSAVVRKFGDDIERNLAGNAFFAGPRAQQLAQGVMADSHSPDFPQLLREHLTTEFPDVHFDPEHWSDLERIASEAPDDEIGARDVLDYLSGSRQLGRGLDERAGVAALGKSYISPQAARKLSTFYNTADTNLSTRWYDTSRPGEMPGQIEINGEMHPIEGPFSVNEHLQNYIPLPDARALRQATTHFPNLLGWTPSDGFHTINPFLTPAGEERVWLRLAESTNSLWKRTVVLTRPAVTLRMLGGEQLAAATDGTESAFSHVFRLVANRIADKPEDSVVGRVLGGHVAAVLDDPHNAITRAISRASATPSSDDLLGAALQDGLNDRGSAFARASSVSNDPLNDHPDRMFIKAYGPISRSSRDPNVYLHAWGRELSRTALEPVDAPIAEALTHGVETVGTARVVDADARAAALDAIKERFWTGDLAEYRQSLKLGADGGPHDWRSALVNREGSDNYIDAVANRVSQLTAEDPDLLHAIADKTFQGQPITSAFGNRGNLDPDFVSYLSDLRDRELGPDVVRGQLSVLSRRGRDVLAEKYDQAMNSLFQHTIGIPSQKFMREPAFRDAYQAEAIRLAPAMSDEARQATAEILGVDAANLPAQIARESYLTPEEADLLSKNMALDKVQRLFYDAHARNNLTDALRIISPFADVWRQEAARWARLGIENAPLIVRRLGQLNGTLRASHILAPDPRTGKETLHIPIPGWAQEAAGAVATGESGIGAAFGKPFVNSIGAPTVDNASLNINPLNASMLGQGLPGVGAVASVPLDAVMSRIPGLDSVRKTLMPYGAVDTSKGVGDATLQAFTPTWLKSFENATLGENAQRNATTMADVISYLQSARPQDYPNSPAGRGRLLEDATKVSHNLWIVKGIAQAVSPASPTLEVDTKTKQGWVELEQLAKDWYASLNNAYARGGTSADATREYLDRWGPSAGLALTSQTEPRIYGLAATSEMESWRNTHPDLARDYADIWPLFVPRKQGATPGSVDYLSIQRQIGDGERTALNPRQRLELADYRLGQFVHDHYRAQLGANPGRAQSLWLQRVDAAIGARFPGWALNAGKWPSDIPDRVDRDAVINYELPKIAADPRLADNPVAQATLAYLHYRTVALGEIGAQYSQNTTQSLGAKRAAPLRAWLASVGERILAKYPQWAPMWDSLFRAEVAPDSTSATDVQNSQAVPEAPVSSAPTTPATMVD